MRVVAIEPLLNGEAGYGEYVTKEVFFIDGIQAGAGKDSVNRL